MDSTIVIESRFLLEKLDILTKINLLKIKSSTVYLSIIFNFNQISNYNLILSKKDAPYDTRAMHRFTQFPIRLSV